jgi:uncharacterized DUF497 family protein
LEELTVETLQWDRINIRHCRRHGLTIATTERVLKNAARFFPHQRAPPRLVMIGPDDGQRIWTVILERKAATAWRPITGWPSKPKEIRRYNWEE